MERKGRDDARAIKAAEMVCTLQRIAMHAE